MKELSKAELKLISGGYEINIHPGIIPINIGPLLGNSFGTLNLHIEPVTSGLMNYRAIGIAGTAQRDWQDS